jgi:hypothetical protein
LELCGFGHLIRLAFSHYHLLDKEMYRQAYLATLITILLIAGCEQSLAQTTEETQAAQLTQLDREHYSPHLEKNYPQNLYWGETHLHTTYSTDSGLF